MNRGRAGCRRWSALPRLVGQVHDGSTAALAPLLAELLHWFGEQALGAANAETLNDVKNLADFLRETGREREARALEERYASKEAPR